MTKDSGQSYSFDAVHCKSMLSHQSGCIAGYGIRFVELRGRSIPMSEQGKEGLFDVISKQASGIAESIRGSALSSIAHDLATG